MAVLEGLKGIIVLLLGFGLLALLHKDVEEVAQNLLAHLHINPDRRLAQVFLNAASHTSDARIWAIAGAALAYSSVRFVEAWGLWNRRVWAEWFALLSGALYLPWEILKLIEKPNGLHIGVFVANIAVLAYMAYIRIAACGSLRCAERESSSEAH